MNNYIKDIPNEYILQMTKNDFEICKALIIYHGGIQLLSFTSSNNNESETQTGTSIFYFDRCIISLDYNLKVLFINFSIIMNPDEASRITITLLNECGHLFDGIKPSDNYHIIHKNSGQEIVFGEEAEAVFYSTIGKQFHTDVEKERFYDSILRDQNPKDMMEN